MEWLKKTAVSAAILLVIFGPLALMAAWGSKSATIAMALAALAILSYKQFDEKGNKAPAKPEEPPKPG